MNVYKKALGRRSRRLALAAVALLAVACAKTEAPDDTAAPPETMAWADRTHEQKAQFMKKVIVPEMNTVLVGFEELEKVTCKTCHGENPKATKFAMPSPELPQLDPADHFAAHGKKDVEFMMNSVSPKMAELLGVEAWSPENKKGFGCFSCHTPSKG